MTIYVFSELRDNIEYDVTIYINPTNELITIGDDEITNVRVDRYMPYIEGDTIAINVDTGRERRVEALWVTMAGQYTDDGDDIIEVLTPVLEAYGYTNGEFKELI